MTIATLPERPLALNREALFDDLGYTPHEGQWEVHRSLAPRRVLACGVRWGKTRCAAMEGLAAALEPNERSTGWVVAPTYDLADKVFRELVILTAEHLRHRIVTLKEHERKLVLRNLGGGVSEIRGKTADNPVSLLGEGLDWLIVDEAARMKPAIWESHLTQRLIDKRGWALLISTPRGKGWFYEVWRRGHDESDAAYASWNSPSWQNPHLDRALIEGERGRLPERVYRQEYGGEFIEGAGAVFRNVRECATGTFVEYDHENVYFAGLDLAKVEDYTVLVILDQDRRMVFTDRFHRLDWSVQVTRIREGLKMYGDPCVLVDSTGAGEPIYESLCEAGCRAEAYPFTARSKAALVNNLALLFEKRDITLPRADLWPVGIEELEAFEYSVTDSGNVRTAAAAGAHDDTVAALALAAWQARRRGGDFEITWL